MAQLHRGDTHLYFWYCLCADMSFLRYKELQKLSKKYKFSYFMGHRVETPWPIWIISIKTCASLSPKYRTTFGDAQAKTKGSSPIHESEYPHPKKFSTPRPGAPMGRSSPNYLVPVPGVCSTLSLNFTPIAPFCVEISSTVQKKQT